MEQIQKLVEYSHLAGFPMFIKDDVLMVRNGTSLPPNLKEQITIHKEDIIQHLKGD